MQIEINYLAAFLVALLGGVHCFGMCGGIVGVLTLGLPAETRERFGAMLPYLFAYNAGRILSYSIAGMLAGGLGAWAANWTSVHHGQRALQALAGLFMVMLGLYLAGWWFGLARVEQAGGTIWRYLEPLGRRLLPVRTPGQALSMGVVWGWLPCGLVYSVLIWAMSAGSALNGALLMLSFGIGTLPALLSMGAFAATMAAFVNQSWVRQSIGTVIIIFGIYQIMQALSSFSG